MANDTGLDPRTCSAMANWSDYTVAILGKLERRYSLVIFRRITFRVSYKARQIYLQRLTDKGIRLLSQLVTHLTTVALGLTRIPHLNLIHNLRCPCLARRVN